MTGLCLRRLLTKRILVSVTILTMLLTMNTGITFAYTSADVKASYQFNNNSNDSSGNNKTGTLNTGASYSTDAKEGSNSLSLDGNTGFFTVPSLGTYASMSLSTWVKINSLGKPINSIMHTNGWSTGSVHTMILNSGKVQFSVNGNSATDLTSNYAFTSADFGTWKHIAIVYDSSAKTVKFYINGMLDATRTYTTAVPGALLGAQIGAWDGEVGLRNFNGKFDDFRIFSTALTDADVASLAGGGMVANYQFNNNANDSSGNNKTGTLNTGASYSTDAKEGSNSLSLDGNTGSFTVPSLGTYASVSLSTWVKINSLGKPINSIMHTNGWSTGSVHTMILNSGKVQFSVNGNSATDLTSNYAFTSADFGTWKHIAIVYDSSVKTVKFYINGTLDVTRTYTTAVSAALLGAQIGAWDGEVGLRNFNGKFDDFRIYGKALNDSEVQNLVGVIPPSGGTLKGKICGDPYNVGSTDYCVGDIWGTTWADDGNLYCYGNDTYGFWNNGQNPHSEENMSIFKLSGSDPHNLTQTPINWLNEYMIRTNYNWKSSGMICINGVLYMGIYKHIYADSTGHEYSQDASIIKSTDHGLTWTRSVSDNTNNPMFRDSRFSNPWFIQYGQNYTGTADGAGTGSNQYVYAVSTNGFYNSGDSMYLGRVLTSKIGDLNGADWQYYKGGDGMQDSSWSSDINLSVPIVNDPNSLGKEGIQYIPSLKTYFMIQWHYPLVDWNPNPDMNGYPTISEWTFYQSTTPWGPWTKFGGSQTYPCDGYYCPNIPSAKFITPTQDGVNLIAFTTGNFKTSTSPNQNNNIYRVIAVPITLSTTTTTGNTTGVLQDGAYYKIKSMVSGKLLTESGTGDGSQAYQWDDISSDSQQWKVDYVSDRWYKLTNKASGKVLEIQNGSTSEGAQTQIYYDNGSDAQRWKIQCMGTGYYKLYVKCSGKVMDLYFDDPNNGGKIQQWSDNGSNAQRWQFIKQ